MEIVALQARQWEHLSLEDRLEWLCNLPQEAIKLTWQLDEEIASTLKLIGKELCSKLWTNGKCTIRTGKGSFVLFYIENKILTIKKLGFPYSAMIYSIKKYFPQVLEEPDSAKELESYGKLLLTCIDNLNLLPLTLTSPVHLYEKNVLDKLDLPTVADIPEEAAQLSYKAAGKLWIEAQKLGHWNTLYEYDRISAFPNAVAGLWDIRRGVWIKSNKLIREAVYGYCKCDIRIDKQIHGILHRQDKLLISPTGHWPDILNKAEMDYIEQYEMGTYKIKNGIWWIPNESPLLPISKHINRLIVSKEQAQDPVTRAILKGISVGIYGKFGEVRRDGLGKHFNPVWFCEASTSPRIELAKFIHNNKLEEYLVHTGVDGLLSEVPARYINRNWKAGVTEAIIASSGNTFYGNRKPLGLTIGRVKAMIKARPYDSYYEECINRRVTLGEALLGNWEELGQVLPHYTSLDILLPERDRVFSCKPHNGYELMNKRYGSKAIEVNLEEK